MDAVPPAERALLPRLLLKADELSSEDAEPRLRAILSRRRGLKRYAELERLLRDGKLNDEGLKEEFTRLLTQLKGSAAKA